MMRTGGTLGRNMSTEAGSKLSLRMLKPVLLFLNRFLTSLTSLFGLRREMNDVAIVTPPQGHRFGSKSLQRLSTCHPDLQRLAFELDKWWECSVPQYGGHRGETAQDKLFHEGRSTKRWPQSRHNSYPSEALDICPWYPDVKIPWNDVEIFRAWGGFVLGISKGLGIKLRWGGDWDGDWTFKDQRFIDMPHFELVEVT